MDTEFIEKIFEAAFSIEYSGFFILVIISCNKLPGPFDPIENPEEVGWIWIILMRLKRIISF